MRKILSDEGRPSMKTKRRASKHEWREKNEELKAIFKLFPFVLKNMQKIWISKEYTFKRKKQSFLLSSPGEAARICRIVFRRPLTINLWEHLKEEPRKYVRLFQTKKSTSFYFELFGWVMSWWSTWRIMRWPHLSFYPSLRHSNQVCKQKTFRRNKIWSLNNVYDFRFWVFSSQHETFSQNQKTFLVISIKSSYIAGLFEIEVD